MQLKNTFALTPDSVGLRRGKPALAPTVTMQLEKALALTPALSPTGTIQMAFGGAAG
jgi:hypothetical protein